MDSVHFLYCGANPICSFVYPYPRIYVFANGSSVSFTGCHLSSRSDLWIMWYFYGWWLYSLCPCIYERSTKSFYLSVYIYFCIESVFILGDTVCMGKNMRIGFFNFPTQKVDPRVYFIRLA